MPVARALLDSLPNGRAGEIRTHDLSAPNVALYQAKLRPDLILYIRQFSEEFPPKGADGGRVNTAFCIPKQGVKHDESFWFFAVLFTENREDTVSFGS